MSLIYFTWFRTHGKWGCGNMVSPYAAEFCTVLVTVIFTINGVYGEKLQQAFAHQDEANGKFRHQ